MDEAREMLDQLMGKTRNLTNDMKETAAQLKFSDKRVCKYFLCGLCPYLTFITTKSDIGKCPFPICGNFLNYVFKLLRVSQEILMQKLVKWNGTNYHKKKETDMGLFILIKFS